MHTCRAARWFYHRAGVGFCRASPAEPPANPHGPRSRRSLRIATCMGISNSISRTMPSPPREIPGAAGISADRIVAHADWIGLLEHFDRGVPGIGHVGVDGGNSVDAWAGAHATGDGFVVGEGCAYGAFSRFLRTDALWVALARGASALLRIVLGFYSRSVARIVAAESQIVHGALAGGGDAVRGQLWRVRETECRPYAGRFRRCRRRRRRGEWH